MSDLHCKEDCLRTWAANSDVSRLDYFSPHKLSDLHDHYFKGCMWRFSVGDIIYVKDPDGRRAELEILNIDEEDNAIQFAILREIEIKPISKSGFAIEKRRVGIGYEYFIIGPDGETIERDIVGPKAAKKALEWVEKKAIEHAALSAEMTEAAKPKRKAVA